MEAKSKRVRKLEEPKKKMPALVEGVHGKIPKKAGDSMDLNQEGIKVIGEQLKVHKRMEKNKGVKIVEQADEATVIDMSKARKKHPKEMPAADQAAVNEMRMQIMEREQKEEAPKMQHEETQIVRRPAKPAPKKPGFFARLFGAK